MPQEEIIVQTADEVANIDFMRKTNDMITEQTAEIQNNMDTISEQLDIIIDNNTNTISGYSDPELVQNDVDLSEVTELIENIDTALVESNTQDILVKLNQQQEQINNINEKLDLILSKL